MRIRKPEPEKYCLRCGERLHRKTFHGRLEDYGVFLRRKYCGLDCAIRTCRKESVTLAGLRSRAQKYRGQQCDSCGTTEKLNVHHRDLNPANNSAENLLTLCSSCHTRWHWEHGKTMPRATTTCSVCGTPCEHLTHGMCQKHYQRWKKYGDPLMTAKIGGRSSKLYRVTTDDRIAV